MLKNMSLLAAGTSQGMGGIGGEGLGPFGQNPATSGTTALTQVTGVISSIIGFMTIIGGVWFMFQILIGGYEWISSGGDAKKLETARNRLSHAFIGLVIVVGAWALLAIAGQFFGFDILISNPGTVIQQLKL
jgi:hypothetical protein